MPRASMLDLLAHSQAGKATKGGPQGAAEAQPALPARGLGAPARREVSTLYRRVSRPACGLSQNKKTDPGRNNPVPSILPSRVPSFDKKNWSMKHKNKCLRLSSRAPGKMPLGAND